MTAQSIRPMASGAMSARFGDVPDILTPRHLTDLLPIGRNVIYGGPRRPRIKSIWVGQKLLITKATLREFPGSSVE